jgi:phage repressor protein C with HTH and peptisase S24 domain
MQLADVQTPDAVQLRGSKTVPVSLGEDKDIVMVPFYNGQQVAAGAGMYVAEHQEVKPIPVITSFLTPYNPATVKALKVKGDSMTRIGLFDGDVVFFVPISDPGDGVYVLSINTQLLVKRVEFDPFGTEIRIISENERYQPRILRGEDMNAVKIEGKVIGWLHKHPY